MTLFAQVAEHLIERNKTVEALLPYFPGYTKQQINDALRNAALNGLCHVAEKIPQKPGAKGNHKAVWAHGPKPEQGEVPQSTPRGEYAWIGPVSSVWDLSLRA